MKVDKNIHKLLTLWVRPMPKSPLLYANQLLKQEEEVPAVLKPQHSLTKPYRQSLDWWRPKWNFSGHANMTTQYVGLTKDHVNQYGAVWNTEPLSMENWMTELNFRIHGHRHHGFGDGLTLWCTTNPPVNNPGDNFQGLAISIDTHNDQHRHGDAVISAKVHSGRPEDGAPRVVGECDARVRNLFYDPWIQISYYKNLLTVSMSNDPSDDKNWIHCFNVPGILLPKNCYLGCSATTSELKDQHQVLQVKTYQLDEENSAELKSLVI